MTPSGPQDHLHPDVTQRSGYRYLFTAKHHGAGGPDDARWSLLLSQAEEFFDFADLRQLADHQGRLYGLLRTDGVLRDLGTWGQQIAEFPVAHAGQPWHGYPIWAVNRQAPANRADEQMRPAKAVFELMERLGLLSHRERKRLSKGNHV